MWSNLVLTAYSLDKRRYWIKKSGLHRFWNFDGRCGSQVEASGHSAKLATFLFFFRVTNKSYPRMRKSYITQSDSLPQSKTFFVVRFHMRENNIFHFMIPACFSLIQLLEIGGNRHSGAMHWKQAIKYRFHSALSRHFNICCRRY